MARNPLYATGLPLLLELLPNCHDRMFKAEKTSDLLGPFSIGDPAGHTITLQRFPFTTASTMLRYDIQLQDANENIVQTLALWVTDPSTSEAAPNRQAVIEGVTELAGTSVYTVTKSAGAR